MTKMKNDTQSKELSRQDTEKTDQLISEITSLKRILLEIQNEHDRAFRRTEQKLAQLQNENKEMKIHISKLCNQNNNVIRSMKENSTMINELAHDKKMAQEVNNLSEQCSEIKEIVSK